MQGKGAGAVNRVELECQVLCAALRQSWVRHDKVGAFTSIRELSHLFPDLLPPPEELNGSNKANYYEVLSVRPGSGLNGLVVAYLRTVRKFLKDHNPKDYRQYYNAMLNAGFVLRKPRLRLSHDLVVARRWLYESQLEEEEAAAQAVLLAETPVAAGAEAQTHELPQAVAAVASVESADSTETASAAHTSSQAQSMAESNLESARNSQVEDEVPSYQPPAVDSQPEDEYDPLEIIQKSLEQAKLSSGSGQSRTSFEMPEQHAFTPPTNTPPPSAVPDVYPSASDQRPPVRAGEITQANPIIDPNQLAQAIAASQPGTQMPIPGEPSSAVEPTPPAPDSMGSSDHVKFASEQARFASEQVAAMQAQADASIAQSAAKAQAAAEAQAAAKAQGQSAGQGQQSNAGSYSSSGAVSENPGSGLQSGSLQSESIQSGSGQHGSMQPGPAQSGAAANAQHGSASPSSTAQSNSAAQSEHSQSAEPNAPLQSAGGFHFDEKQLHKPDAEIELPGVIRLMEASHLISKVEVQALKAQMQLAPNIAVEQLILNAGYATRNELMSLRLAQDLLSKGTINMAQFQVAMYDERTSGLRMAESLQVRGWLETEVKNPVEEFKKTE